MLLQVYCISRPRRNRYAGKITRRSTLFSFGDREEIKLICCLGPQTYLPTFSRDHKVVYILQPPKPNTQDVARHPASSNQASLGTRQDSLRGGIGRFKFSNHQIFQFARCDTRSYIYFLVCSFMQ